MVLSTGERSAGLMMITLVSRSPSLHRAGLLLITRFHPQNYIDQARSHSRTSHVDKLQIVKAWAGSQRLLFSEPHHKSATYITRLEMLL